MISQYCTVAICFHKCLLILLYNECIYASIYYVADDISTKMIGSMSSLVVMVIVLLTVTSGSGYPHSGGTVGDCQKDDNMVQSEAEYSEEHGPKYIIHEYKIFVKFV